jgi:hypothetical protein
MDSKKTEKLLKKYPKIFAQYKLSPQETAMCWLFEHGNGWYILIDQLCSLITNHIKNREQSNEWRQERNDIRTALKAGDETPFNEHYKSFNDEWRAHTKIQMLSEDNEEIEPIHQVEAVQVKEKFGGLRFYINGGDDTVFAFISFAEQMSYYMCEFCGSTKNIGQTSGWITTECKECATKNNHTNWKEYDN